MRRGGERNKIEKRRKNWRVGERNGERNERSKERRHKMKGKGSKDENKDSVKKTREEGRTNDDRVTTIDGP